MPPGELDEGADLGEYCAALLLREMMRVTGLARVSGTAPVAGAAGGG
jgi:hypothetical protein